MSVRSQTQVRKIQHRLGTGDLLQYPGVLPGSRRQVRFLDRHGMDLLWWQRGVRKQAFAQVSEVPIQVAGWSDALIHLHHMDALPWDFLCGQVAKHLPRR